MYGTIFRLRPQESREADVVALMEEWGQTRGPQVSGARAAYLLRSERRPGDLLGVAVFDDEATYRANATTSEQDAWYRRLRDLLDTDPEWEDGPYVVATRFPDGSG